MQLAPPRGLRRALRRNAAVGPGRGQVAHEPRAAVDAVFLTWNSREQALECVRHTLATELVASLVVVDNASSDGTADAVRAAHPDITVIALEQGVGLAEALNMGAKLGDAPFVLYLNDDVFAEPGAIATLLEALEARADAVAAGGRLVEADLSTQDQYRPRPFPSPATVVARLFGFERLWPRNPWTGTHLRDKLDDHTTVEVDQPAGACLLVRRPVVEAHRRLGRALLVLVRGRRLLAAPRRARRLAVRAQRAVSPRRRRDRPPAEGPGRPRALLLRRPAVRPHALLARRPRVRRAGDARDRARPRRDHRAARPRKARGSTSAPRAARCGSRPGAAIKRF